jgi:hypothetical protein
MADFKPINFRKDKWQKIADLASLLSEKKGVDIRLPEAVDTAVDTLMAQLAETK